MMTYIQPLLLILLAITLLGLLVFRFPKGKKVALGGVLGLLLISWPPMDWLLARPLEARYPVRPFQAPADLQAVVVLASSVDAPRYERPYPLPDPLTFQRSEYAAWIS